MLRIGIVGIGFIGQQHFQIWPEIEGAEMVAVADPLPERVSASVPSIGGNVGEAIDLDLSGLNRYASLAEMLKSEELDCVDICAPTFLHAELSIQALRAGCHVICEKPMALSSADCDRMMEAAAANDRQLFIAQCIRFWPAYEALADIVREEKLGRVAAAKFSRMSALPQWSVDDWITDPELSGGAALDLHLHDVDFINSLWGMPPALYSTAAAVFSPAPVDHVLTHYMYDREGMVVYAEGSWGMPAGFPFNMSFQVVAERGTVAWSINEGPAPTVYPLGGEPHQLTVSEETGYQRELAYFTQCMQKGEQPTRVLPSSARNSVRLVEAERQSAEEQTVIKLEAGGD